MIAAYRTVGERVAVAVVGKERRGNRGNPCHWFDHPNELRRPKHGAELAKTRGKVGDADGAALPIGENRRYDRRITKVLRLEIGYVIEHDIRKSFFFVAGKEPAEDRVAVEARIAPPHQTRRGIDERGSTPVADAGKVKPVIGNAVANASVRQISSRQRRAP